MRFAKRIVVYPLRSIYRAFFEAPLWRLIRAVKGYFLTEVLIHLENIERVLRDSAEHAQRNEIEYLQRENFQRVQRENIEGVRRDDTRIQLETLGRKIASSDLTSQQLGAAIEERLRVLEASNAAQWDSLEQLLLAMYRTPELRASEPTEENSELQHASISSMANLGRVHAASNIR